MFIIEAILKYIKKDKFNEILETHDREQCEHLLDYIPLEEDKTTEEDLNCEHIFMPVDSTGDAGGAMFRRNIWRGTERTLLSSLTFHGGESGLRDSQLEMRIIVRILRKTV